LQRLPTGRAIAQDLPEWRRLLADPLSTVFRTEQAQGYNPVTLKRYWFFVRAVTPVVLDHNLSIFYHPPPVLLDLFQVRYVVAPRWPYATRFRGPLAAQGPARLFESATGEPRASVVGAWTVASGFDAALQEVTRTGFDPRARVVLEADPGLRPGPRAGAAGGAGSAEYTSLGTQTAKVRVEAASPALVLIRIPYAKGWHATVDGHVGRVLPADFVVLAVPVGRGRHTVLLRYDDPSIGHGLVGSALGVGLLVVSIVLATGRDRRRRSSSVDHATVSAEIERLPHPAQPDRAR
jgi:hypothetical protein